MSTNRLPPVPLPDNLWGDRWQFAALPAGEVIDAFADRLIPILVMPDPLLPLNLGLALSTPVPGVVISGGRQALRLAQWVEQSQPSSLNFISGAPNGLILEAGLCDRWVVATFEDPEVATAAQLFSDRKIASRGLHFLLVQPDESGITYSGFWLLK
jgi:RNA-binding protein Tab2/Atab2